MRNCVVFLLFLLLSCGQVQADEPVVTDNQEEEIQDKCPKLTGRIVGLTDPEYDLARLVSNYYTSKNKFPDVIVYCQNTQDIQNAVKWARCHQMPIRIRSGGHNHEAFSTGKGIVIDVSEMKQIEINHAEDVAIVQPGLTGGELYKKLFDAGYTQVGGTCADVGISGLILTGGIGPLYRRHGLACDSLLSLDIVDANGELIHATKDNEYKDLFWASCGGGGGNFGVVTSLTLKVYRVTQVTWFNIGWDWDQPVGKIIAAWQNFFSTPDKKWFSHLDVWAKAFPVKEFNKQPVKILGVFWGTPEEAKQKLAPLIGIGKPSDLTIELVNWDTAIRLFEESTSVFITSKPEYKSPAAFAMKPLPPEAINIITSTLKDSTSPLLNVLFFSLGDSSHEISPTDTAFFYRDAQYFISYSTQWLKEKDDVKQIAEVDKLRESLLPYTIGDYIGNPDKTFKDYLTIYYGENARRLQCIKRKYDPDNVFQFEQSIPPAAKEWNCP